MRDSRVYEMIVRYLSGEMNAKEKKAMEDWMNKNPDNRLLFEQAAQLWKVGAEGALEDVSQIDKDWQKLQVRLGMVPAEATPETTPAPEIIPLPIAPNVPESRFRAVVGVAAALLLLAAFSLFLFNSNNTIVIATANGEQENVRLPDGSEIALNYASKLQYAADFSGDIRRIRLQGEAFLEVVPDGRPFIVETENVRVEVLGTAFNVWQRGETTRVVLVEGKVRLQGADNNAVLLEKDQASSCSGNGPPTPPETVAANRLLGWRSGKLVFEAAPLREILAELQWKYNVTIVLDAPGAGEKTINAVFHTPTLESVLRSVCESLNLQYRQDAERFIVSK